VVLSADRNLLFPFSSFRIIPYQEFSGAFNMAFDHFLAVNILPTDTPILRFYGWHPYCISLGYHQKDKSLDLAAIKKAGYEAVRRPTGGSAIFHSEELTYSFIVPKTGLSQQQIYHTIHLYIADALQQIGYEVSLNEREPNENYLKKGRATFACFNRSAHSEIQFAGRKILGSAQKIYQKSVLQHGSLLIGPKQAEITRFLKGNRKSKDELSVYLKEHSASLHDIKKMNIQPIDLSEEIIAKFYSNANAGGYYLYPTIREIEEAKRFENIFIIT